MKFAQIEKLVLQWGKDKGIIGRRFGGSSPEAQYAKLIGEAGELGEAIAARDLEEIKDGIGDCIVVLTMIWSMFSDNGLEQCYRYAYNQIKERSGKMVDGLFVKDNDNDS